MRHHPALLTALLVTSTAATVGAATLDVGPGKKYAKPCDAIKAAAAGDLIQIDTAGKYDGDVCAWSTSGLTLRGVGAGRAHVDSAGQISQGKAIWVIAGDDTTLENIELSGATLAVDKNGAGIRHEGKNLTVRNCFFHNNDDGILTSQNPESEILIERSEFADNGFGDGFSHNMYIGHIKKFTIQYSFTHGAKVGHLIKSRAAANYILYNRISDDATGSASYEINLPNAGQSYVIGNLIEQGPMTQNPAIVDYASEGATAGQMNDLFLINNTIVNDRPNGGTFLQVAGGVGTVIARNNIFLGPGTITNQPATVTLDHNWTTMDGDPKLADAAKLDYHLAVGSPCAEKGVDPGKGDGASLTPLFHYVHPAGFEGRKTVGTIDIGAYELGGGTGGGGTGGSGASSSGSGAGGNGAGSGGTGGGVPASTSSSGGNSDNGGTGGCGCRAAGEAPEGSLAWAAVALGVAAGRGISRRSRARR